MNVEKDIDEVTPVYTISTIAKVLGISVQTLRLYEREHLIIPTEECRTCSVNKDFNSYNHIKNGIIEISRNK